MIKKWQKNDNASRDAISATCKSAFFCRFFVIFLGHFVENLSFFCRFGAIFSKIVKTIEKFFEKWQKNDRQNWNDKKNDKKMTDETEMTKKRQKNDKQNDRQNWNDKKNDKKLTKKWQNKYLNHLQGMAASFF